MNRAILLAVLSLMLSVYAFGKEETIRFLGIPVDGPKSEMIRKLQAKGYEYVSEEDFFMGFYMGDPVYLFLQVVNEKVSRVIVYDIEQRTEEEIKYRFNSIYGRFASNRRYERLGKKNRILSPEDKLAYEMKRHKYVHKAVFKQVRVDEADAEIAKTSAPAVGVRPVDMEQIKGDYRERRRRMHARAIGYVNRHTTESYKSQVWFVISERFGKFGVVMLYDNVLNLLANRKAPRL